MATKLVFFGNERLATGVTTTAPTLQALIEAGYEIGALVVAQSEATPSRKRRQLEVAEIAERHHIPILNLPDLKDPESIQQIAQSAAEAAVLVAYGKIVPPAVLDIFPKGIINVHPSLLPKHRGPTPIESVILQADKETGVSLIQLSAKMDAGPIYAQETVLLHGEEDKQTLADQLLGIGKDMLTQYLPQILGGELKPSPQNDQEATYDNLIKKADGEIKAPEKSAAELARQVRAYKGWPRSRYLLGATEVVITKAHATDINGVPGVLWFGQQQLGIHCQSGTIVIDALIPAGKKEMPITAFLAGYHPTV